MVRLEQILSQKQILAPQQILQASLLQLTTMNLELKILDELESNPVLELAESDDFGDQPITENGEFEKDRDVDVPDDRDEYEPPNVYQRPGDEPDLPQAESIGFIDSLVRQLNDTNLTDRERLIAEEILWNLDDRGYLATELVLIADRFDLEEDDVLPILKVLQHFEPPGVAARNLRECLLIQLDHDPESPAYRILRDHFDDFANRRFEAVQQKSGLSMDEIAGAMSVIAHLNPTPGEATLITKDETIIPDIIVREQNGEYVIQINDGNLPELRINPDYLTMMDAKAGLPAKARNYLKKKVDSGHWFIQAIQQRRETMTAVMKAIIERQPEFFAGDLQHLNPMKLQDIADAIGMDISTISRSTRGKYVDTEYGVVELKSFFTEGMAMDDGSMVSTNEIKQSLMKLIEAEDKSEPLNDDKLAEALNQQGYPVARRTVAKYREQLHQPVARLRRQLNA